ncbi:BQ5605_C005g03241 [Microbotryum silenes-dioicae]|uniref:BQ5605_C005g03241 protein n=1 Tax=Microbotryum silenes-dioicae TaxID=796604 RepID=A0A2X0MDF5_9BASI|nr:BQ5605_C005g03241 [Microbotryum silenes-dioicae]
MSSITPLSIMSFGASAGADPTSQGLALPPFASRIVEPVNDDPASLSMQHIARTVLKAKRVVVVCGAGISCASGIPDFRSSEGLFDSLKRQHPEARLNTGKDLFDASLFSSEQNASIFYTMIAELKSMADVAQPTAFHSFLKALDDEGKLMRVYTQNIDGLEEKAGLSYGLGDKSLPLPPRRATARSLGKTSSSLSFSLSANPHPSKQSNPSAAYPSPAASPPADEVPPPPTHSKIPRCIPLHGHLGTMSCAHCSTTVPINPFMPALAQGTAPTCPSCESIDLARTVAGDRSRGVGRLRPDVVLYGEEHRDGERVGEITHRDLIGARPDLLLVVGTTLKVPGTKRLVRELSKVTKPPVYDAEDDEEMEMPVASGSSTSSNSSGTTSSKTKRPKPAPVHVVYLNYEFPKPSTEWKDVFDVWLRGDIQAFVQAVHDEKDEGIRREMVRQKEKELRELKALERARARVEQEVALANVEAAEIKKKKISDKAKVALSQASKTERKPKPRAEAGLKATKAKSSPEPTAVPVVVPPKKTRTTGSTAKPRTTKTNKPMTPLPTPPSSQAAPAPTRQTARVAKQNVPVESMLSPLKTRSGTVRNTAPINKLPFAVTKLSYTQVTSGPSFKSTRTNTRF